MNMKNRPKVSYRLMLILAIIVGVLGIVLQFLPGSEFFSIFLTAAVLGGLIGGSNDYEARDRQQLERSYKPALEWLFLFVFVAYAFIELSRWLLFFERAVVFLNGHWPGFIIPIMCLFMGIAGLRK